MPTIHVTPGTAAALERLRLVAAEATALAIGTLTPVGLPLASDSGDLHVQLARCFGRVFDARPDLYEEWEQGQLDLLAALATEGLRRRPKCTGGSR